MAMQPRAGGRPGCFDDGRLLILRGAIDARNARLRMSGRIIGRSMGRGAMQVAILEQPRKFVVRERPVPRAEAGEAVVRIAATAVCHTAVSYTHLRAHETVLDLVCRLLLEK